MINIKGSYHMAGQAVIWLHFGHSFESITVFPLGRERRDNIMKHSNEEVRGPNIEISAMSSAGFWTVQILNGEQLLTFIEDMRDLKETENICDKEFARFKEEIIPSNEAEEKLLKNAIIRIHSDYAKKLVQMHWGAIERVAQELIRRHTLYCYEVKEIIASEPIMERRNLWGKEGCALPPEYTNSNIGDESTYRKHKPVCDGCILNCIFAQKMPPTGA
jgi:hypothetical protein